MIPIRQVKDLNVAVGRYPSEPACAQGVSVEAYFSNLEGHLISHIRSADIVVGCIAWLTSSTILKALGKVPGGVSIIVQKEEFLRPDLDSDSNASWREQLRSLYEAVPSLNCWPETLNIVSAALYDDNTIKSIRCAGMSNPRRLAQPRMHHKFLVFCRDSGSSAGAVQNRAAPNWPVPYAVWTGSFNLTANGRHSLENAVFLEAPTIAKRYYDEWQSVAWISEPLDWNSEWVDQEWGVT